MKRNLLLVTVCAAAVMLVAVGCKKKKKDESKGGDDMQVMSAAMDAMDQPAMDAMDKPMDKPAAMKRTAMAAVKKDEPQLAGGSFTFKKKMLPKGTKRLKKEQMQMNFTIEAGGRSIKAKNHGTEVKAEEILAVKGDVITKLKVNFKTMRTVAGQGDKEKTITLPIEGKTFVLEKKGDKVVVTDEGGKAAADKLAKEVRKQYKSFGKPDKMFTALPKTAIKVGDKIPALAKALEASFREQMSGDRGEKWEISGVSVSLKGIKDTKIGVFAIAMQVTMQMGPQFKMVMHIKGDVHVREDGHEVASNMVAPLDVMGKKNAGKMTVVESTTYSK